MRFSIVDSNLNAVSRKLSANEKIGILIEGEIPNLHKSLTVGFALYSEQGDLILWSLHKDTSENHWPELTNGKNTLVAWIPPHFLNEGTYRVELNTSLHFSEWIHQPGVNSPVINFQVEGGLSESPFWLTVRPGITAPILDFELI